MSETAANENRSGAQKVPVLGVREIPTVNYKGYVDRSIVTTQTGPENSSSPKRMWTADPISLDFWASELESLDLLPVKRLLSANIVVIDGYAQSIETMSVLEQLPLDIDTAE